MRKLLLITTALVGFAVAEPAEAAPVGAWVATSLGFTSGTLAYSLVAGSVALALQIGATALLRRAMMGGRPRQDAQRAELTRPKSLPEYRFVYGKTWAPGTPVGMQVVGRVLYMCCLLNSRRSAGPFKLYLDKREVEKTGNEFNFNSGGGASASNEPFVGHVKYWIGNGTQTQAPAEIVSDTIGYFTANDSWQGRTVIWLKIDIGDDDERATRWPAQPPKVDVEGQWSIVDDPRTGTSGYSANQALCVLDALRNNPICPYINDYLRLDTFEWGADVADQAVPVKGGGTIPRYECNGILVFSDGSEIEDQLQPLLDAGASAFSRIGGRLAFVPTVSRAATHTISDVLDISSIEMVALKDDDELFTEGLARFPAPDRAYEATETPLYISPGAQDADGGLPKRLTADLDMVTDYRQAERVVKILVERSRMQRSFSGALPPEYFDLVAGSVVNLNLGVPFGAFAGKYIVDSVEPAAGINRAEDGDDGYETLSLYLPTTMTETSDAITSWNPATDEMDMVLGNLTETSARVQPPSGITMLTGSAAAITTGDTVLAGVIASWSGSNSPSAYAYWWEYMVIHPIAPIITKWLAGGNLAKDAADENGIYTAQISGARLGWLYRVRVRTVGTYGNSDWSVSDFVMAIGPSAVLQAPEITSATPVNSSRINVIATQANDIKVKKLQIFQNDVDSPLTATQLGADINAGASVSVQRAHTGLSPSTTKFYFARAVDAFGNQSDFSASVSATTPA